MRRPGKELLTEGVLRLEFATNDLCLGFFFFFYEAKFHIYLILWCSAMNFKQKVLKCNTLEIQ